MKKPPVVIIAPDPPSLRGARLAAQFAAGCVVGALLAMAVLPLVFTCSTRFVQQEQRR
jgi:hypothetical protein